MRKTFLFLLPLLLTAGAAHGARGQREISLAGALLAATIDDLCEKDEPDCDDSFESALITAGYGYHVRDRFVIQGALVFLGQSNASDSVAITVLQPSVKFYFGDPDVKTRFFARASANFILVDVDTGDNDTAGNGNSFGAGLGVGFEVDFDGPFFVAELRYDDYGSSFSTISIPFGIGFRF